MRNFQDKHKNNAFTRVLYSTFGIGFLGLLVLVFAWGVVKFMFKMQETVRNRNIAEQKVIELERRKKERESDIADLNSDKGKEKVFREDFGMGRVGEGLIIVVEDKTEVEPASQKDQKGFASFFKNWFK